MKPEVAVVKCQNLTYEQKAQARQNIGALADGAFPWFTSVKIENQEHEYGVMGAVVQPEPFEELPDKTLSAVLAFYGAACQDGGENEPTILRNISAPVRAEDAANKGYVDGLVGNIETALDGILAIQNALIGGDAQ